MYPAVCLHLSGTVVMIFWYCCRQSSIWPWLTLQPVYMFLVLSHAGLHPIMAHLLHLAQLVHVFLVLSHAVLSQVKVSGVLAELLLVLGGLLQHLGQVTQVGFLRAPHSFGLRKLLQLARHLPGEHKGGSLVCFGALLHTICGSWVSSMSNTLPAGCRLERSGVSSTLPEGHGSEKSAVTDTTCRSWVRKVSSLSSTLPAGHWSDRSALCIAHYLQNVKLCG